ncbi:hypothetical protein [Luteolibacter marinus]|nr:hypothetical protein [Luteolibacter marinus]
MAAISPKIPASNNASDKAMREESGLREASLGLSMPKFLKILTVKQA